MTTELPDPSEVIRLWPEGPPTRIEIAGDEVEYMNGEGIASGGTSLRNISDPTLSVFTPSADRAKGVGVIVAPGGGWTVNMWTHEGLKVASWLTAVGYTVFLLKYRVQATDPDQAKFEARMAGANPGLAGPRSAAALPRAISDLVSTEAYLRARDAAADDGRRAIRIVREGAERFGVRPDSVGMIGFSAGAFLAVDVALVAWIERDVDREERAG